MQKHIIDFLNHLKTLGYSERTVTDYRYNLAYFTDWLTSQGIESLTAVSAQHISAYQQYLFHEYTPRRKKTLSPGFQINLLKVIKPLFRWLVKTGAMLHNPSADLTLPRLPRRIPRGVMTKREIRRILKVPDLSTPSGKRDRLILELLYATGIRKSELINLRTRDIDSPSRQITIRAGKGGHDRTVPLAVKAARHLEEYIRNAREKLLGENKSHYLLINDRGRKLDKHSPGRLVAKCRKAARLKKHITTHSFRHTCATHLLKGRASIRSIQELLGHKSLNSTQQYTRVDISDLRRVIDRHHPREGMNE